MEQGTSPTTVAKTWRHIRIVFWGIVGGIGLMTLIALILNSWMGALLPKLAAYLKYLVVGLPILGFFSLLLGRLRLLKKLARSRQPELNLSERLAYYQQGFFTFLAFLELVVMVAMLLFLFTGEFFFLIFGAIFLGIMLAIKPNPERIPELLNLSTDERMEWHRTIVKN